MISDLVFGSEKNITEVKVLSEKEHRVGTCTTAERYFFEFNAVQGIRRFDNGYEGSMQIITDETGKPIMLEKIDLGDRSCITLEPIKMGKTEIPAGSLVQAFPREDATPEIIASYYFPHKMTTADFKGFQLLRLSTLSMPPQLREEVFGNHYYSQHTSNFRNYDWIEVEHYRELARKALDR
jgi:hypothetical protein